jgi:hypothetical protein
VLATSFQYIMVGVVKPISGEHSCEIQYDHCTQTMKLNVAKDLGIVFSDV